MKKRDIEAYDEYLRGKGHTLIDSPELDIKAVIKEFNQKWATFAALKNN